MRTSDLTQKQKLRRRWLRISLPLVACLLAYPYIKKSGPVQILRAILTGEPGARVVANDLADDVRHKWRLGPLQQWSTQVLSRYRAGQVVTNGHAAYWSHG